MNIGRHEETVEIKLDAEVLERSDVADEPADDDVRLAEKAKVDAAR